MEVRILKVIRRMLCMCDPACVLLFCAFLLLVDAGGFSVESCGTYFLAEELLTLPQAILLVVMLAGVMIEERRL